MLKGNMVLVMFCETDLFVCLLKSFLGEKKIRNADLFIFFISSKSVLAKKKEKKMT